MDKTVPAPAAKLLDFIGDTEVGRKPPEAYNVVYGHNKTLLLAPVIRTGCVVAHRLLLCLHRIL